MSFDVFHVFPYCYWGLYLEGRFIGEFFCVMSLGDLYLEGLIFVILRY